MASTTAFCTAAKLAFLRKEIGGTGDSYKIALYTSTATHDAATTVYSATNEVSGTGYTATGNTLAGTAITSSGTTAFYDFNDTSWTTATFTAASCLIYDDTDTVGPDRALSVHDFGGDQTVAAATFTLQFPTPDATNAIIRVA